MEGAGVDDGVEVGVADAVDVDGVGVGVGVGDVEVGVGVGLEGCVVDTTGLGFVADGDGETAGVDEVGDPVVG